MNITRAAFGPHQLTPDQQHLSVFEQMWHTVKGRRGARYKLKLDINLTEGGSVKVTCLSELKEGNGYLLEAEPNADGVYHYIRLVRGSDGMWQFDMVLGALNPDGISPYERGVAMRPCFV